ncbi:MAG: PA2779 family protein [Chromatiales bacterium]|jgi:hypothetical protein
MQRRFKSIVASFLALMMLAVSLSPAYAGIMSTTDAIQLERGAIERGQIVTLLDRADVREQLNALGVDPEDAKQRVAAMTDQQVQELNQQLESLPAGSSTFGTILIVLLIVFIVFVITDATGATDIFPFVKPVNK